MHRFTAVVTGTLVGLLAIFASAVPASAHDQLTESTPAADERLTTAPAEIRLRFSAEVLDAGAAILVVDASGDDHAGALQIDGDSVTAPVDDLDVGGYQVRWRVVSSDGHPISGIIPFTVGDAEPMPLPSAGAADAAPGGADVDAQADTEDDAALRIVLLGAGGAAAAVALWALITFLRRRARRGGTDAAAVAAGSDDTRKTDA